MKITRLQCDDWEAFYLDGTLIDQHHHVQLEDVFKAMGVEWESRWIELDWENGFDAYPRQLKNLDDELFETR